MADVKVIQRKPYMFDNGESYMGMGEDEPSRFGPEEQVESEWSYYDEEDPDHSVSIYTNNYQSDQQQLSMQ